MTEKEIKKLVKLRTSLVQKYTSLKDYKQNKNALMKEYDYAALIHNTVVSLDSILKNHVTFSEE